MTEQEWRAGKNPVPLFQYLQGRMTERQLRLFAAAALNTMKERDQESIARVEVAERFADGLVTVNELRKAWPAMRPDNPATAPELAYDWAEVVVMAKDRGYYGGSFPILSQPLVSRLLRDVIGNPFHPVTVDPAWLTSDVVALAAGIYQEKAFDRMPIIADALQDAGCQNTEILEHCRGSGPHVRGCWVVDALLGKEWP